MTNDEARVIRNAYIERRGVNAERDIKLRALIQALGKPVWDSLQQECQIVGLLTIIEAQLVYLVETFDPEGREYELKLVLEDLHDNPLFQRIVKSPSYEYINDIGRVTTINTIRLLRSSIEALSKTIMETLQGPDSDHYRNYMDYTALGSKSTALKIQLNETAGAKPMFFI